VTGMTDGSWAMDRKSLGEDDCHCLKSRGVVHGNENELVDSRSKHKLLGRRKVAAVRSAGALTVRGGDRVFVVRRASGTQG
jgi:hypothetical protein